MWARNNCITTVTLNKLRVGIINTSLRQKIKLKRPA